MTSVPRVSWYNRSFHAMMHGEQKFEDIESVNDIPNFFLRRNLKDTTPILATAIGIGTTIFGFKKESLLTKIIGGLVTCGGLLATGLFALGWLFESLIIKAMVPLLGISDGKERSGSDKFLYDISRATSNVGYVFTSLFGLSNDKLPKAIEKIINEHGEEKSLEIARKLIPAQHELKNLTAEAIGRIEKGFYILSGVKDPKAKNYLESLFKKDDVDIVVKRIALRALALKYEYFGKDETIVDLFTNIISNKAASENTSSDKHELRCDAIRISKNIVHEKTITVLGNILKTNEIPVRIPAADALLSIDHPKALEKIEEVLKDPKTDKYIVEEFLNRVAHILESSDLKPDEKSKAIILKLIAALEVAEKNHPQLQFRQRDFKISTLREWMDFFHS